MGPLQGLGRKISPSLPAAPNFLHYFLRDPLAQLGGGLDPEIARRLRTDFLDLGILWADLRIRLASGREADARRDALRTLDEAERLFGASPVLEHERRSHAEALGLTDVARAATRCRAELARA